LGAVFDWRAPAGAKAGRTLLQLSDRGAWVAGTDEKLDFKLAFKILI
jgi:hypothetical protein